MKNQRGFFSAWHESEYGEHVTWANGAPVSHIHDDRWQGWQAAKARAVPEGFVLVPREPTEDMLGAAWEVPPAGGPSGNRRVFYEKQTVVYKAMVDEAAKEMTEAQEQSHD